MSTTYYILGSPVGPVPPDVVIRPSLPEFDEDSTDQDTGAPLPVYTVLRPETFPSDIFWRGDAWGLTIKGLPIVPGGGIGEAQSRVLTYFLDRYGLEWEDRILKTYVSYGYTYISLSPQDSFAFGTSEDDYVRMSVRCRKAGLNVHHLMRSKYYTSSVAAFSQKHVKPNLRIQNRLTDIREPSITPASSINVSEPDALIERLLREGVMQVETPAWEMNYWSPSVCRQMIDHDAALIGSRALIMLHFYPHYISWQENNETPTDFWQANYGKVDGILYQCDPYWTAGMMAARIQDGLDRLAPGGMWGLKDSGRTDSNGQLHDIWYVVWETIATCQFNNMKDGDGRLADEDIGNLKGYECTCSPGAMTVKGYGNGGRLPDGSPL